MLKKIFFLLLISFLMLGWSAGDFNLRIRFSQTEGLKKDDRIIFEKNNIGKVEGVIYSKKGNYIADVKIDKGFKNAVTEHSRFFIINDPSGKGRKAVEMVNVAEGGATLEKGSTIEGTTRLSLRLAEMEDSFGKAMSELQRKINEMAGEVKQLSEREEIKNLEYYLSQLKEKMKKSGKEFREKIQKELLPWIQKEIEKLKERLKKYGREKEVEPLEVKMEEIRKI